MLQNLQLGNELATTTGSMTLTPANSNVSQEWVLTNKLVDGKMPSLIPGTSTTGYIQDDVTGGNVRVNDGNGFYCAPDETNNYKSCYYNWYTITAGSGTSTVTGKDTTGVDVNESICPRGWVLPKGGSDSSTNNFQKLYNQYPSAAQMLVDPVTAFDNTSGTYKPGLLLNGYYNLGGIVSSTMGVNGYYWTRTAYSNGQVYTLFLNNSTVNPQGIYWKYNGFPARCMYIDK